MGKSTKPEPGRNNRATRLRQKLMERMWALLHFAACDGDGEAAFSSYQEFIAQLQDLTGATDEHSHDRFMRGVFGPTAQGLAPREVKLTLKLTPADRAKIIEHTRSSCLTPATKEAILTGLRHHDDEEG